MCAGGWRESSDTGPPPTDCCLCTDSKSIKQQLINSYVVFYFLSFLYLNIHTLVPLTCSPAVPLLPCSALPLLLLLGLQGGREEEWDC